MAGGLVAVAFSDVVSSTELWSTLGDARANEVRRRLRVASEGAVAGIGGVVVKDMGDGLMVTFPTASASIDGAVALQRAAALVARATGVTDLRIRVGVSIGEATNENDDWFGVPVVEAARLCAAADPSQILVTDSVVHLARRSEHVARSVGERVLKGLPDPVQTSAIEWSPNPASNVAMPSFMRPHADDLPFTGRQTATRQLHDSFTESRRRHLVFVSGEPGIGKTRLLAEFSASLALDGTTLLGSAYEQDGDQTWRALFAGLRDLAGHHEPPVSVRAVLAAVVPGVELPADSVSRTADLDPATVGEAVAEWLRDASESGPVVWVIDDLHWAAAPALQVLRNVVPALGESPVLLIGAYRDTDLDRAHPLAGWLADLRRRDSPLRIDLHGLSVEDTRTLLAAQAPGLLDTSANELAEDINRETEGNAFFIGQVIEHLVETEALVLEDGRWRVTVERDRLGLPQGVREVVGRRLERLPDGVDEVLAAAAVQGRDFLVSLSCAVLDADIDRVADAFDAAEAAGLIRAESGVSGRFRFVHALVRQTVLEELSTLRRGRLHLRTAQALDRQHSSPIGAMSQRIAGHYLDASAVGGFPRAVEMIIEMTTDISTAVLELALRALADADDVGLDDRSRVRLHMIVARSAWVGKDGRDLTTKSFVEAARLAESIGDPELFAEAVATGSNASGFGMSPEFLALVPRALAGVDPCSPPGLELRWALLFAHSMFAPPGTDPAADYGALCDDCDEYRLNQVRMIAGWALHSSPDIGRALDDHAISTPIVGGELFPMWIFMRIDLDRAEFHIVEMIPRVDQMNAPGFSAGFRQGQALVAIARGDLASAPPLIEQITELAGNEPMFAVGVPWQQAVLAGWRGDLESALALSQGVRPFNPYPRLAAAAIGVIHLDRGDRDAALAEFRAAYADGPHTIGRDWTYTGTIGALAELAAGLGATAEAAELDAILEPFDGQFLLEACIHLRGSVAWIRGGLALCLGDVDEAIARYRRAEDFEAEQGAHCLLARTRVDLAAALSHRGAPGDLDEALRLLNVAESEAARMGAGLVTQRAARVRDHLAAAI